MVVNYVLWYNEQILHIWNFYSHSSSFVSCVMSVKGDVCHSRFVNSLTGVTNIFFVVEMFVFRKIVIVLSTDCFIMEIFDYTSGCTINLTYCEVNPNKDLSLWLIHSELLLLCLGLILARTVLFMIEVNHTMESVKK